MSKIDIGKTYGSLTVVSQSPEQKRSKQCECFCLCGKNVTMYINNLIRLTRNTCYCEEREKIRATKKDHRSRSRHNIPEYKIWKDMRKRCFNKNCKAYSDYGGRGITICPDWSDFLVFYRDLGPRPSQTHSIERVDNNGIYCKDNCRWATRAEQTTNTRRNHYLSFNGETKHLSEWARTVGLSEDCLERRLNKLKWSTEKALTIPNRGWGPGKPRLPS
jgi:hypothetical protein